MDTCPCGSGSVYEKCCGLIHDRGAGLGTTAEQLMRARYSAYVMQNESFVLSSWHADTRPPAMKPADNVAWKSLEVVDTTGGTAFDNHGTVEFIARFIRDGLPLELEERSRFVRVDGTWFYVDGE